MKSDENGLKFLYLAVDLIILNFSIAIIFSITPLIQELNYHDISLYLLHANLSWVITYSFYSIKNLYVHDYFSNRVKRNYAIKTVNLSG